LRPTEEVREALKLDQVRFIPLALPAHKQKNDIAPAEDRLEMVRLALEDHPQFMCDPIEFERGGVSYTIDTLNALAGGGCQGHELFFIIGADAFSLLDTWREPLKVLQAANFSVTLRGDQKAFEVVKMVQRKLNEINNQVEFEQIREDEYKAIGFNKVMRFIPVTTLDVSATKIRDLARTKGSLRYLLPPQVEAFIIRRGLYGSR
jgi:nicotinate-nucleotide adenylyltransferase